MSNRKYIGMHVRGMDPNKPEPWGICDATGFVHFRKDLVKQMIWSGQSLVWTGFYVGKDYVEVPNPQMKTNIFGIDPRPVVDPRPPKNPIPIQYSNAPPNYNIPTNENSPDGPTLTTSERVEELQEFNWNTPFDWTS